MELYDTRMLPRRPRSCAPAGPVAAEFDERVATGPYFDPSARAVSTPTTPSRTDVLGRLRRSRRRPVPVRRCSSAAAPTDPARRACGCRSVFIYSTDTARKVVCAVQVDGVAPKDAEKYIAKMDKARARFQFFTAHTRLLITSGVRPLPEQRTSKPVRS